ncbi:mCG147904 [Mus musculus]|nr:mCG147904 [Mus musculus]
MPFLRSSTSIMRYDFESESCFSGVLGYPGLAEVGVLCSDDGKTVENQAPEIITLLTSTISGTRAVKEYKSSQPSPHLGLGTSRLDGALAAPLW